MARFRRASDPHREYQLLAAAAVDGRLDADSATALEAHLATCEQCRADQDAMLADHAWLANPAAAIMPKPEVGAFILEAARAPRVPVIRTGRVSVSPLLAGGLALVLVVAMAIGLRGFTTGFGSGGTASAPTERPNNSVLGVLPTGGQPSATPRPTLAPPAKGPCAPLPDELTAWWRGEDASDAIGGFDGRIRGAAEFSAGLVGNAFTFDGSTAYLEVPYSPTLDVGNGDFTLLLWVRFATLAGEQVMVDQLQDAGSGAPMANGWSLGKGATNDIYAAAASDGRNAGAGTEPGQLQLHENVWFHLAVRRQANVLVIYLDGTYVGGNDRLTGAFDIGVERPLLFGRRGDDRGLLLNGQLDEVKLVVGRALFESDIRADYLAGSTGACPA